MIDRFALLLTLAGAFLSVVPNLIGRWRIRIRAARLSGSIEPPRRTAGGVLAAFGVLTICFAAFALWHYWPKVKVLGDLLFLAGGLLLTMVGGMFVQVLTSNIGEGKSLLDVSASRLLYPLLFSPIVFYPIWLVGYKEATGIFPFYAAFLNGYFWQSVVAAAKKPEPPDIHSL